MKMEDYVKKNDLIERRLGDLVQQKLAINNATKNQCVTVAIINDCIDLLKSIQSNIYAFEISYKEKNNGFTFRPSYYYDNILIQNCMIWERMIVLVGIIDQLDVHEIFVKKNVDGLFKQIKKNRDKSDGICKLLLSLNEQLSFIKQQRASSNHYISPHLDEIKHECNSNQLFFDDGGILKIDMKVWETVSSDIDDKSMEQLKKMIPAIRKRQDIYIDLLEKIIDEVALNIHNCQINGVDDFFINGYFEPFGFREVMGQKEEEYANLRNRLRIIIGKENENGIDLFDEASRIRNTLLIDAVFRAKEIVRSINCFMACWTYEKDKIKAYGMSKDDFEKYICNQVISSSEYYFFAEMKTYSLFEKIAKFLLCKYDFDHEFTSVDRFKNMYFEDILELFNKKGIRTECIEIWNRLLKSEVFKTYEEIRNLEYHCLRQEYLLYQDNENMRFGKLSMIAWLLAKVYDILYLLVEEEEKILELRLKDIHSR